jgi:hypothetical protein
MMPAQRALPKKSFIATLVFVMLIVLAGCGSGASESSEPKAGEQPKMTPEQVIPSPDEK